MGSPRRGVQAVVSGVPRRGTGWLWGWRVGLWGEGRRAGVLRVRQGCSGEPDPQVLMLPFGGDR